ncbi:MAG: TetR family transcriptional regulator [Streptosporangiales bacterium]|nr:TetR family transcriptional regulator [Streptosporangiales bacterium]
MAPCEDGSVVVEQDANRPLRADAQRNRARVLETAEQVFVAEGLSVRVDEIARRAGVGVGTVYRHFPTKDALFEAIVTDRVQWLVDEARSLGAGDDPGGAFFRYLHDVVELAAVNKWIFDALTGTGRDARKLVELGGQFREALGELLARAQAAGAVRDDVSVTDLKGLLTGAQVAVRDGAVGGVVADVLCTGLRSPPG